MYVRTAKPARRVSQPPLHRERLRRVERLRERRRLLRVVLPEGCVRGQGPALWDTPDPSLAAERGGFELAYLISLVLGTCMCMALRIC